MNPPEINEALPPSDDTKKIHLFKVPTYVPTHTVKQLLIEHFKKQTDPTSENKFTLKRGDKSVHAYLCFNTGEECRQALHLLDGFAIQGSSIQAQLDASMPVAREKKRKHSAEESASKEEESIEARVQNQVTPLWKLPYSEQLIKKERQARHLMKKLERELCKLQEAKRDCPAGTMSINDTMDMALAIQHMDAIAPSPRVEGYRNKCEFAIGYDLAGKTRIGFTMGSYVDGIVEVASPAPCLHVDAVSKSLVQYVEDWLCSPDVCSAYPPYDRKTSRGFWRLMCIRTFCERRQIMLLYQIQHEVSDPGSLVPEATEAGHSLLGIQDRLVQHCRAFRFMGGPEEHAWTVASIQLQISGKKNLGIDPTIPFVVLYGQSHLTASLLGCEFSVSGHSFFQVNTECTAILYQIIQDLAVNGGIKSSGATPSAHLHLLDLCCGAGTIGICLGKSGLFKSVVGIESVPEAIEDAKRNTTLNEPAISPQQLHWVCSKVEQEGLLNSMIRSNVLDRDPMAEIVVVLDPPRSGVHSDVIRSIRAAKHIGRVVYVSCHPEAVLANLLE